MPTFFNVILQNHDKVQVKVVGIIKFASNLILHNIPEFHFNLIFVHKLMKDLNSTLFFTSSLIVTCRTLRPQIFCKAYHDLYYLHSEAIQSNIDAINKPHFVPYSSLFI